MKTLRNLLLLFVTALLAACDVSPTPIPRHFDPRVIQTVEPKPVNSTWRFETVYTPKNIQYSSLALDSKDNPHIAYGGDQLYYAWFDGSVWQHEVADSTPGAGRTVHLVLDSQDQPHFLYGAGSMDSMVLLHTYRNQTGWQHETVFPSFCQKSISDAAIDPHGRLVVVFDGSLKCNEASIYEQHIWYAQQAAGGWEITRVSDAGWQASLVFDPSGQPLLSFYDGALAEVLAAARQASGWVVEKVVEKVYAPTPTVPFFDVDGLAHVIFIRSEEENSYQHAWKDSNGWHVEAIQYLSFPSETVNPFAHTQEEINAACSNPEKGLLLTWKDAHGWRQMPVLSPSLAQQVGLAHPDLKIDCKGRTHWISLDLQKKVLDYALREGNEWHHTVIDRGGTLSWPRSELAFDLGGRLVSSFYSTDGFVHYLWQEAGDWQAEAVSAGSVIQSYYPIDLLFDAKNRAHLFYIGPEADSASHPYLAYAVRENNRWSAEGQPLWVPSYRAWTTPVINPQGWPVFLYGTTVNNQMVSTLMYRTPAGWNSQALVEFQPKIADEARPQMAYSPQQASLPSPASGIALPAFVYTTADTDEAAYFDPQKNQAEILPVLDTDRYASHYAMQFDPQGRPVIFIDYYERYMGSIVGLGDMLFITQTGGTWQAYQIAGVGASDVNAPFLDRQGQAHFARGFTYVTGSATDWKTTPIQSPGLNLDPKTMLLVAQALREDGKFCIEVYDFTANDLLVGCLESIE